jgi:DNA-binding transcriptional MerR regulator
VSEYRISELAGRSGVPATTLRFYEQAGLLPASRSPSGYRIYDDDALERLAFISSGKSLGLPLEEIRDLLGVWEQGVCAAVRERLRPLVAERIADADRRVAELSAFSAQLALVHRTLGGPAPAGACGPDCGCTSTPAAAGPVPLPLPLPVELTRTRPPAPAPAAAAEQAVAAPSRDAPVACTLAGAERDDRIAQWHEVLALAEPRETVPDGLRLSFPPGAELAARLARLAAAEQDCCPFYEFTLHLTPTALVLDVRAPEAAVDMVADLFGASA